VTTRAPARRHEQQERRSRLLLLDDESERANRGDADDRNGRPTLARESAGQALPPRAMR
jgi:hypothetical protein